MGINRLQFLLFYGIFILFIIFITGLAGPSLLPMMDVEGFEFEELPQPTGAWWEIFTIPFTYFTYFGMFLTVSSEYTIIFILILMPFIIGMVLVIAEMIRGN